MKNNKEKYLSLGIERILDDLGRVVVPKEMRRRLGFETNQKVSIRLLNGSILIEKSKNLCHLCFSEDNIEQFNNVSICRTCLNEIIKKFND